MKVFCSCGEEIRQQWLVLCLTQQYSMLHMNSGKISCILGIPGKWFSEMLGTKKMVEQIQSEKYSPVVLLYFSTSVNRLRNCTRTFSTLPQFKLVSKLIVSYQKRNIFAARIRSLWEGNVFSRVCLFTGDGGGVTLLPHTDLFKLVHLGPSTTWVSLWPRSDPITTWGPSALALPDNDLFKLDYPFSPHGLTLPELFKFNPVHLGTPPQQPVQTC